MIPEKSKDFKQNLSKTIDLVDFLRKETGIPSKQVGASIFLEHCPFCGGGSGKYKNFAVQTGKRHYGKCFRCGWNGDAIEATKHLRNCTFKQAVSYLNGESLDLPEWVPQAQKAKTGKADNVPLARQIWSQARALTQQESVELLSKRHFHQTIVEAASKILRQHTRVNQYESENFLIVPMVLQENAEISGICRILLSNPHNKKDLGNKGYTFLQGSVGNPCIIVESFFNGLALAAIGYSAIVIYSCTNKQGLESASDQLGKEKTLLWLDRCVEEKQWEYSRQYDIPGVYFDAGKPDGYDINDMLKDEGLHFKDAVDCYAESASKIPPYPVMTLDPESEEIADYFSIVDIAKVLGYELSQNNEMACPSGRGQCTLYPDFGYGQCSCSCGVHDIPDLYARVKAIERKDAIKILLKKIEDASIDKSQDASIESEPLSESEKIGMVDFLMKVSLAGKWGILEASTGIGKSYAITEAMIKLVQSGKKVGHVSDSKDAMFEQKRRLQAQGYTGTIALLYQETNDNFDELDQIADIVLTHIGYLRRKNESAGGYVQAHRAFEGRHVFIDEAQQLFEKNMLVDEPLAARCRFNRSKHEKQRGYRKVKSCPRHAGKGNCLDCELYFARIEIEHGSTFLAHFKEQELSGSQARPSFQSLDVERYLQTPGFSCAWGTKFLQQIDMEPSFPDCLEENQCQDSWENYVDSLLQHLWQPQIRSEFPIAIDPDEGIAFPLGAFDIEWPNQEPSLTSKTRESLEMLGIKTDKLKIRFPKYPCVPHLFGIDLYPLLCLGKSKIQYKKGKDMQGLASFDGAKSVIFASATMPEPLRQAINLVCSKRGIQVESKRYEEKPWSFNVALLKTSQDLSSERFLKLILDMEQAKAFVTFRTKAEAENKFDALRENAKFLVFFLEDVYIGYHEERAEKDRYETRAILTYANATICRGFNYPELNLVMVDCASLMPMLAMQELKEGMTQEEKNAVLSKHLRATIAQIVGRAMRSNLPRIPGQTVKDDRQIVVVLHNIDPDFEVGIDQSLCHSYVEHRDWLSSLGKEHAKEHAIVEESFADTIQRLLAGDKPQDWKAKDQEIATDKAKVKGLRGMSKGQRKLVDQAQIEQEQQEARSEQKQESFLDLQVKIARAARDGEKWRDITRKYTLTRLKRKEQTMLKQIFVASQRETID